ncbi:MAG: hypothetical protein IH623_06970 [Verrucomicrobia bacterium]|nr:hypothetical protein [Verrucomicrobiota bacterium]
MDIPISYLHQVWLQPFSAGGYVPLRLRSWYVHGQVTNKPSEFEILAAGTNVLYPSLSPFELYAQAREGLLDQDRLYIRKGTNLIEIPRAGTSAAARVVQPASTGRWLATVLFVIISVAFAFLSPFMRKCRAKCATFSGGSQRRQQQMFFEFQARQQ